MRILVESSDEKTIRLIFPTGMIFNRLTATVGSAAIKKHTGTDLAEFRTDDLKPPVPRAAADEAKIPAS